MVSMPILKSARTVLTPITIEDADFLHEQIKTEDWRQNIYDYQFTSIEQTVELIQNRFIANVEKHGYGYFIVNNADKRKIGVAGFLKKDHLENPDLGFAFMPEYYRQGFAFEVSELLLEYAKNQLKLTVIDAEAKMQNVASQKLLLKLGFEKIEEVKKDGSVCLFRKNLIF